MHPTRYALFLMTICLCAWPTWSQTARPSTQPADPAADEDEIAHRLGDRFTSLAAGISFRAPAGGLQTRRLGMGSEIVQYSNGEEKWVLKVSRLILQAPARLTAEESSRTDETPTKSTLKRGADDAKNRPGLLDQAARQLRAQDATAQILRQDVVNVGPSDVGLLISRYTLSAQTWLHQQAFIQATPTSYYIFDLTSPSTHAVSDPAAQEDPAEAIAVQLFRAILDSVQLLDQRPIARENEQRLYRTRALQVSLANRLRQAVVPEQCYRIVRDGKDIGWSFLTEELADRNGKSGIVMTSISHIVADAQAGDARSGIKPQPRTVTHSSSELFCALDLQDAEESWITISDVDRGGVKERLSEIGQSKHVTRRVVDDKPGILEEPADSKTPAMRRSERYVLDVTQTNSAGSRQIARDLPPFYLPQVIGAMLPRALPIHEPKAYLFAAWISSEQEVIYRYIDVESEREVTLDGRRTRVIPISDRIGLEGEPTLHYMSLDGKYLGSVTPASNFAVIAVDAKTLSRMYPTASFERPRLLGK